MTDHLPVFERLEEDVLHRVRGLFEPHRRTADAAPETPAPVPATMAAEPAAIQEETMSLAQIEDDVREDVTKGIEYVAGWAQRVQAALPGLVSTVDAVGGSTVGKLAETLLGIVIPEPYETILVNYAEDFAKRYGAPVPAAPAAPAQGDTPETPAQ